MSTFRNRFGQTVGYMHCLLDSMPNKRVFALSQSHVKVNFTGEVSNLNFWFAIVFIAVAFTVVY